MIPKSTPIVDGHRFSEKIVRKKEVRDALSPIRE
jgi:hypothetical protein